MPENFGDIAAPYSDRQNSRIVIVPVPFDATSTWIKGAGKGPGAILEASTHMELYDIETDSEVYRKGIYTDRAVESGTDPEAMVREVEDRVRYWLDQGKFVVTLGGEHSVSIGAIRAHCLSFEGVSVLQLDAHTDLRPGYEGTAFNHACVMARARELCPITQVGIRSMDESEQQYISPGRIFYQEDIHDSEGWIEEVMETLSDRVYITLDLDVLDPSIMPSTGTPEPGGMDWYTLLKLLRKVIAEKELTGFDVVELCPSPHNRAPDFLAAKLIYKILSYRFR